MGHYGANEEFCVRMKSIIQRVILGMGVILTVILAASCKHQNTGSEGIRQFSYRGLVASDKPVTEKVDTWLDAMSREDKIGQLMMISLHGTELGQSQRDVIRKYRVGGILLTNENLMYKNQVKAFIEEIHQTAVTSSLVTPYIAINRDKVERRGDIFLRLPEASKMGQYSIDRIINLTTRSAIELRDMGFNLVIGPNANLGVPHISYTADPTWAGHINLAMAERYQINHMWFAYNYFPSLGTGDRMFSSADETKDYLSDNDVDVFKRLVKQTTPNTYMVMVSHAQFPAIDSEHLASSSKSIITDWLRSDLGYDGIIMTDRIDVGALQSNQNIGDYAVASVLAGSDIILLDADTTHIDEVHRALSRAVENGDISEERLNASVRRILSMKMQEHAD